MAELTNAASRVYSLLKDASRKDGKISAAEAWAQVFGEDEAQAKKDPYFIQTRLSLIRGQTDLIENEMRRTEIPEDLVAPYCERVRRVVSPTNLTAHWQDYQKHLQPDVFLCLRYCEALLGTETSIPEDELQRILDKVEELRREIEDSGLSNGVYQFLSGQIDILARALNEYPIRGPEAIREAFKEGFADLADHVDDLKNSTDQEEARKVATLWREMKRIGGEVVEADRIATAYVNLIEKGQSAAAAVQGILGNP